MIAIKGGHLDTVAALVKLGAQMDRVDKHRNMALHFAVDQSPAILAIIMNESHKQHAFGYFRAKNRYNHTPLAIACFRERLKNVQGFLRFKLPFDILCMPRVQTIFNKNDKSEMAKAAAALQLEMQLG